ncbi:hypothetical protein MHM39_03060 [Phaeobacter sp. CNT1-3]|nr:hypothetical protein [Phaeobacter sp. CNT1-3]
MQVRILPGSPKSPVNTGNCGIQCYPTYKILHDFAVSVREHVKNTGTKPVQLDSTDTEAHCHHKQKNPGSAATETGIKSKVKASSFPCYLTLITIAEATCIQGGKLLPGGAS